MRMYFKTDSSRREKATNLPMALAIIISTTAAPAVAESMRVVDGDTIEINNLTYRLHGADAPEAGQSCNSPNGGQWPCGKMAVQHLEQLIGTSSVVCEGSETDQYGRIIGTCFTENGTDLNGQMVLDGMAWAYVKYSRDYVANEESARHDRRGVWQTLSMPPWEYRAERWSAAQSEAPDRCPIKGNINSEGVKIYHTPWSPYYSRTKVSEGRGEQWFCDESQAIDAGWRAPKWGATK